MKFSSFIIIYIYFLFYYYYYIIYFRSMNKCCYSRGGRSILCMCFYCFVSILLFSINNTNTSLKRWTVVPRGPEHRKIVSYFPKKRPQNVLQPAATGATSRPIQTLISPLSSTTTPGDRKTTDTLCQDNHFEYHSSNVFLNWLCRWKIVTLSIISPWLWIAVWQALRTTSFEVTRQLNDNH